MSEIMNKMRVQMMNIGAESIVNSLDASFRMLEVSVRAVTISKKFACACIDDECFRTGTHRVLPCGHRLCEDHVFVDPTTRLSCPTCGTLADKIVEDRLILASEQSIASFFGRAVWADPPTNLLAHLFEETPPEFHRGLFIGFLSMIEARTKCAIASFAPAAVSALEFRSSRECDLSPLAGLALFYVVWRHQLCKTDTLDSRANNLAEIAFGHGLFATWTRRQPHPEATKVAEFLVALPDNDLSDELVTNTYKCAMNLIKN